MSKRRWTEAEQLKLRAYAQTKYAHQIAELLGRSRHGINNKAERMGIHLKRTRQWSAAETTRLIQLRQTMTFREIGLFMNRPAGTLRTKAAELGLPLCRRYAVGANGAIHHSDKQVAEVKKRYWAENWTLTALARTYNISPSTIFLWVNFRTRKDAK